MNSNSQPKPLSLPNQLVQFLEVVAADKATTWLQDFLGRTYTTQSCAYETVLTPHSANGLARFFLTMQVKGTIHTKASLELIATLSAAGWMILINTQEQNIFNAQDDWLRETVIQTANKWHRIKYGVPIEIYKIIFPALCEDGSVSWNVRYYLPDTLKKSVHSVFVFVKGPGSGRIYELLDCAKAS